MDAMPLQSVLFVLALALGGLVLVLWVCLPFAVFGTKPLLTRQVQLLEEQNALLRAMVPPAAPGDPRVQRW